MMNSQARSQGFLQEWFCFQKERKNFKVETLLRLVKNLSYIVSSIHWG